MSKERIKFALRMSPETQDLVKSLYAKDNCSSQNEFIEKAIIFYGGYITTNDNAQFLNRAILTAIKSALKETENKNASNIFRLSVEMAMMMNILAAGLEISEEQLYKLRGRCVQEVKKTRGKIAMEDAVKFQQDLGE